jgi:uncharacterized protein (DUF608 family)
MKKKDTLKFEYSGKKLNHVAFPLGGIGAGMICLEGSGTISNVSLRHEAEVFNEPRMFSALTIKKADIENLTLVLEGQVPRRKTFGTSHAANGLGNTTYGLPRFTSSHFSWEFPFAKVALPEDDCPVETTITGWSPFIPNDSYNSSLPIAALEFTFENITNEVVEAVYSFNTFNFLGISEYTPFLASPDDSSQVKKTANGFVLIAKGNDDEPWRESYLNVFCDDQETAVNPSWFRGAWFDSLTVAWQEVASGECPDKPDITAGKPSPGASLYVPFKLNPGETKTINIKLAWYTPHSRLRLGAELGEEADYIGTCECREKDKSLPTYAPWYAAEFKNIAEISDYWKTNYTALREKTLKFSKCLNSTDLPEKILEAITANLAILKSPTILRQFDGRIWGWEGCCDTTGCCAGTCTHVWNYAQSLPHLFPELERTLRQTEFNENQTETGGQSFRASLPIRPVSNETLAAADGQLGGIMKIYREWRVAGDIEWLKSFWTKVKQSLNYCIETWDPDHIGVLKEPHHNTYDIQFWGADGMCSSFYLGALKAAALMAEALGDESDFYLELYRKGRNYLETELFNGEYFIQKIQWKGLRAKNIAFADPECSPESKAILEKEGPKYQYGEGCLSDGVLGAWMAEVCGVGEILDPEKVKSHLQAVHKYNLKHDLSRHVNPQRPGYALGNEGGLLLCSWPRGGALSLPFVYSDEVWTGIEYQVASHLMMLGCVKEGTEIVEIARKRYDGSVRNPFNEYECGHWYSRAMSSYALFQGITGIRYDAVEKILYMAPKMTGNFSSFLCTSTGYGRAGIINGKPFWELVDGHVELDEIICIKSKNDNFADNGTTF